MSKAKTKTEATEPRPACADQYFGRWLVEPKRLIERLEMFRAGAIKPKAEMDGDEEEKKQKPYTMAGTVAIIAIHGEMMKGDSSFGGTVSTVRVRRAIRQAVTDPDVRGVMLHIDSPGGTVAGTADLADDVLSAQESKPVHAHIADLGASAAYWVASQAGRITTTRTSLVGSLGTVAALVDESGALDKLGIKVHVVSTGDHKGAGFDGRVTEEMIDDTQRIVDGINEHFIAAVRSGRGMSDKQARELFDGRVHVGTEAHRLGLVDAVSSFDEAVTTLISEIAHMTDQDYDAYNKANPDKLKAAASGLTEAARNEGFADGEKAERSRTADILGIKGIDLATAAKHIAAGSSKSQVLNEVNEALAKRLADAEAKATQAQSGQHGVPFVASSDPSAEPKHESPEAQAAWEFDNGKAVYQSQSRAGYIGWRARELKKSVA